MRRFLACAAVGLALLAIGWRLERAPGRNRAHSDAPSPSIVDLPASIPSAPPAAPLPSLTSAGLEGAAAPEGICWGAPDSRWTVAWGWAVIEGLPAADVDVREEAGRWVASHGAIQEVFEPRSNGIEHIIHVSTRPPRLDVRIPVDASVRSWDFDGQPRVTLSRPGQGDLLELQGLSVCDAEGRRLVASLSIEPGTILISVEDADAVYPVTIDPLITPSSWTADPMDQSWNEFGTSVAGAGDFNGDGFADIVVGSSRGSLDRVFVFLGSSTGPRATASWTLPKPTTNGEEFGSRVAGAGDVNADGFSDVVVGDPWFNGAGQATLYLGGTSGPSSAPAWTGTGASMARFGESLAAAGDVNRDGRGDLLVGADGLGSVRGAAFLYYGTSTGLAAAPAWSVTAAEYSARFGKSVASAGDVNGDGFLDVVVGAPDLNAQAEREGRAYLYLGTSSGLSTTAAWTADPTDQAEARFGTSVAGAGDINQDGYADVLIGAPLAGTAPGPGRAYLYLGSAGGLASTPSWVVESPDDPAAAYFGSVVASPGDLNGDGRRDVVVSAPYADVQRSTGQYTWTVSGAVYVYLNSAGGLSTVPSMALSPTGQGETYFGRSVAGAGDTNGDGRVDLIVGAPGWDREPYSEKGRAYVYFGASTRTAVPWLVSPASEARLGTATPILDWADCVDSDGIQSYDVEVDDTSTFDAPVRWSGTVSTSQASAGPLPEGGFYWRVRSRDALGNLSDWSLVRKVYADGSGPVAPALSSPVADAWTTAMPRLVWGASADFSGVTNYDVQVASTSDFSGTIEFSATTLYAVDTTALGAGRHYWRVRARDTWGWTSAWSTASFRVDDVAPSAPVLVSPANGAAVNVGNPVFDWTDSTDANGVQSYVIYVDTESSFASPVAWAASVTASQVEAGSFAGTQFFWRVAAIDTAGNGVWSAVGSFTRSGSLPSTVTAVSPWSGIYTTPMMSLDWSDATDPDGLLGYEAQVSTSAGFTTIAWTGATSVSSATTAPLPDGVYYWRARAQDSFGNLGLWSGARSFQVDTMAPSGPSPVSPANGATVYSSSPVLDWTDAADDGGYPRYETQYDTEPTFTDPITLAPPGGPSSAYLSGFADGVYYWRVRAVDGAGNASAYSAAFSFTVDGAPPVAPTLVSPAAGATVLTATPTLDWSDVAEAGVTYEVVVDDEGTCAYPNIATTSGLTASQWTASWLGDSVLRYWRVRAVDARGLAGAWSAIRSFVVDRGRGFYVGLGAGAAGLLGACTDEAAGFAWRPLYTLADATYNAASGETRPAAGDLDGDGVCELVVGRGRTSSSGGWFAIVDDQGSGFTVLRWIQLPFSAYNAANGETWPACGDIDGDGRDEIVVGLGTYTSLGGYFALYDDASTGYAFIGWRRISWSQYNAANGETRPAVGDATGDGKAEVFIGLGRYPSRGGRIARYTSGSVAFSAWMQFGYTSYNSANGETWPACGNIDDDARDELCVGMGAYPQGGGYVQYFNDSVAKYASLGLKRVPWTEYNGAVGETRPSLGPLFGGAGDETVIGLGSWPAARGYVAILQRSPGYALQAWKRFPLDPYNATNGATRPAVRR